MTFGIPNWILQDARTELFKTCKTRTNGDEWGPYLNKITITIYLNSVDRNKFTFTTLQKLVLYYQVLIK
jgi:hypothetical protein